MTILTAHPAVSVIVPCHNYGHFLAEALESVRVQSSPDWECIVVDDGSTDDTRQVSDRFLKLDPRFRYLHQSNKGLSAARNAGIGICAGSYVQLLDADDLLEARKLEAQAAYLEQHHAIDIVYGDACYFNEANALPLTNDLSKNGRQAMVQVSGTGPAVLYPLARGNIMVVNAPLFRKSVIDDVGEFDQDLWGHEDWDYWIRCALAGKQFQYRDEDGALALVRVHASSMSQNVAPMLESNIRVRQRWQHVLPPELRKESRYRIGVLYLEIARWEFGDGRLLSGLRHAALAVWCSHASIPIVLRLVSLLLPDAIASRLRLAARRLHILP
jgi:glycosyltransferase involved in cell wall biosynthesis